MTPHGKWAIVNLIVAIAFELKHSLHVQHGKCVAFGSMSSMFEVKLIWEIVWIVHFGSTLNDYILWWIHTAPKRCECEICTGIHGIILRVRTLRNWDITTLSHFSCDEIVYYRLIGLERVIRHFRSATKILVFFCVERLTSGKIKWFIHYIFIIFLNFVRVFGLFKHLAEHQHVSNSKYYGISFKETSNGSLNGSHQ